MSEQITYLKDTSRYPKVTRNEVKQPKMQITSEEYNKVVEALEAVESGKQPTLVSGVNIATVNGQSLLNGGNITIQGGGGGGSITVDDQLDVTSENAIQNKAVAAALNGKQATLVSGTNIATINGQSLLGGGNMSIPEIIPLRKYTINEYLNIRDAGETINIFYSIYKDGELYRVYLGDTLIMRKKEDGESISRTFPFEIPVLF